MENTPTRRNTLEQGRAQHAFNKAKKAGGSEKFASYAKKLPMMIKTNGLGASLAFAFSKKEADWKLLYDAIESWIEEDSKSLLAKETGAKRGWLIDQLTSVPSKPYRAATKETIAYLAWLRRFAEGFKQDKKNSHGKGNDKV